MENESEQMPLTMDEEMHNVKWLDFTNNLLQVQRNIYLSSSMYDVIIATGDIRFKAHQLILSANSQFFVDIFQSIQPTSSQIPYTVIIPDLNPNLIESLLIFVYCGEVYINANNLPDFLDLCNFLKIKGLIGCNCFINGVRLEQKNDLLKKLSNTTEVGEDGTSKYLSFNDETTSYPLSEQTVECQNQNDLDNISYSNLQTTVDEQVEIETDYCIQGAFIEEYDTEIQENKDDIKIYHDNNDDDDDVDDDIDVDDVHDDNKDLHDECTKIKKLDNEVDDTDNVKAAIEAIKKGGKNVNQIANEHNISKQQLYSKLRNNSDYRILYRSIRHSIIGDAVQAVTVDGLSLQKASKKYAVSKTVLWRNLKKTELYKPEEKTHAHRNDAIAALERGESLTLISKKYKIPLSTLHRDKVRLYDQGKLPKHCTIRKRDGGPDFQNRLKAAITSCAKGVSQKLASEMHNIPKTTIWRYLQHSKHNEDELTGCGGNSNNEDNTK